MDTELARSVFKRWGTGHPVAEQLFYKAAMALGLDPDDALLEARFYTCLDHDLKKVASGARLDDASIRLYSAAAGFEAIDLVKTASVYRLSPLQLAFEKLAQKNWVPNISMLKRAMMAPVMDDGGAGDAGAPMQDPAAMGGGAAQPGMPPPEAGAQVQQDPMRRFKPSPMAPVQAPPSEQGNLQELSNAARHPEAGAAAGMGGMGQDPSMGSAAGPMDPAPPMPPDQKLLAVQANIPPEALNRWAGKFSELEKQVGMSIDDPAQISKFIAQMQKDDGKMVDEAIKNMAVQTAPVRPTIQQQAAQQQRGGGSPPGGGGAPAGGPPGGGGGDGQPPPAQQGGAAPGGQQTPPKPKPNPHQSQQPPQGQQQKVASRKARAWLP